MPHTCQRCVCTGKWNTSHISSLGALVYFRKREGLGCSKFLVGQFNFPLLWPYKCYTIVIMISRENLSFEKYLLNTVHILLAGALCVLLHYWNGSPISVAVFTGQGQVFICRDMTRNISSPYDLLFPVRTRTMTFLILCKFCESHESTVSYVGWCSALSN